MTQDADLMTVKQAAAEANVSMQAIRKAYYQGRLKAQLLAGRLIIRRADFDAYLQTKRKAGRPRKGQE